LDYSSYTGRIAIGRVQRGSLKQGQTVALVKKDGTIVRNKIKDLFVFEGFAKMKIDEVKAGDICAIFGLRKF
jgi:GTP-binding protein